MKKFLLSLFVISITLSLANIAFAGTFYDVKGTVYEGTVNRIARLGIINGISETAYAPNKSLTRGELAKIIVFTRGLDDYADTYTLTDKFSDIKGHWAARYINVAADLGILNGYEDGTFKPDADVSNAEIIVMALRSLGYLNLKPQENGEWYSGYTKRMYELDLNKGMKNLNSYTAAAKRGDFAMLWWNMLVSDKWVVNSENEKDGLTYTYAKKTQLEELFPDYSLVKGKITEICGDSNGNIALVINGTYYITDSAVPLYAYGATAVGVSERKSNKRMLYGLSIDDDYTDMKIVESPIFYLEECGYDLSKAKSTSIYGSKSQATYAYLVVSSDEEEIYRAVLVDASKSTIVDELTVKYDENDDDDDDDDEEEEEEKTGTVILNDEEIATLYSVVIKNGKKVDWSNVPKGAILTELIPGSLYTYSTKSFEGVITDYSDLSNLYVDNDRYIVSDKCVYAVVDDEEDDEEEDTEFFSYSEEMTKSKIANYSLRDIVFYLNTAEEISKIVFCEYKEENVAEKYTNDEYKFLYVTSVLYPSGDSSTAKVSGYAPYTNKKATYTIERDSSINGIGDLIVLTKISGKNIYEVQLIESSKTINKYTVIYDCSSEYKNGEFGEYSLKDNCKFYKVEKIYDINSTNGIKECNVEEIALAEMTEILKNGKINFIADEDMNIEVLYVEKNVNKTKYPLARVISVSKYRDEDTGDTDATLITVKANVFESGIKTLKLKKGECEAGQLVLLNTNEDYSEVSIREKYSLSLIGYKGDFVVESLSNGNKTVSFVGMDEELDLTASEFKTQNKTYELEDYIFLYATVDYDTKTKTWMFSNGKIYDKEKLRLQAGDRIVFDELSNVAVIYRGYKEK